jgi:tetratricopeptide (TPR) repeat protein
MDEQRLQDACKMVDEGRYAEAYDTFVQLAENTPDPLERAWPLIYAANTLQTLGQEQAAMAQLNVARALIEDQRQSGSARSEELEAAELFLDFEDANILWRRGGKKEEALNKFEAALKNHPLALGDPGLSDLCNAIQIRRAFILADLGRWQEALPLLEEIKSPQEYSEGIAFYLGHCYLAGHDYIRAEQKLAEALKLGGLPHSLEYRAHCELGMTCYQLQDYAQAKRELEKCAEMADRSYLKDGALWGYLAATCRALGLKAEAETYSRMARPS